MYPMPKYVMSCLACLPHKLTYDSPDVHIVRVTISRRQELKSGTEQRKRQKGRQGRESAKAEDFLKIAFPSEISRICIMSVNSQTTRALLPISPRDCRIP